jgi:hypothetical protein
MAPALLMIVALIGVGYVLLNAMGGTVNTEANDGVKKLAQAIASAEGFFSPGSRPARNHNPGDMTRDLIAKAVGVDGPFVVYATDADGWANLYAQINLWLSGHSEYADPSSSIADLATFYTTTQQSAWAVNVANHLGVSTDTSIGEIANA